MWFLIIWGAITILTILLLILLAFDAYKRLFIYYKNWGIKYPKKKTSITDLIKCIIVVACPILHLLSLAALIFAYEEVCQKTVNSYIIDNKNAEWELLREKNNNEC